MRKWLIGIIALGVLGGGAYYGLALYPSQRLRSTLDQTIHTLPPGLSASYKDAHYALFGQRATIQGVAIHRDEPNGFDVTVAALDVARPATDFAALWAKAAADPAAVPPNMMLVLADAIVAQSVTYRDATTSAKLASLRVTQPGVYPWSLVRPGAPSLAAAREDFLAHALVPGAAPVFGDYLPFLRAEAALILGVGYDGYDAVALAAVVGLPATLAMPATTVSYTVDKMTAARTDRGDTTGGTVDGLTVQSYLFGSFGIAHVAIEGVKMRDTLIQLLSGTAPTPAMLDGLAVKRIAYGPMALQPPAGQPMSLGTFSVTNIAFSHGLLVSGELAFDGLRIRRSQMPNAQLIDVFDKLGTDSATLGFGLGFRWDLDKQRIAVRDTTLKIAELGALALSLDIDSVGSQQDLITKARLVHATLRYEDASLAERALKIMAIQNGGDSAALRQQLIATATQLGAAPGATAMTQAAARAVREFVAAPRSLQIELAPSTPVPLLTLMTAWAMPPDQLVPRLGLSIAANK
jgi:hypothetical protein